MMTENGIAMLALQETRITCETGDHSINSMLVQLGPDAGRYSYYGERAQLTDKANPTGGTGFLVHESLVPSLQYRGCLRPGDTHRATWISVRGPTHADTLHVGNVYLPDSSKARTTQGLYQTAVDGLSRDVEAFMRKQGRTIVVGDFNARVGRQTQSTLHSRHLAPRCGETFINTAGKQILQLCSDRHLRFISSQTPQAPTLPTATPTFRRGSATSIIDHILVADEQDTIACVAETLPHDSVEIRACRTDHTCVLADLLPHAPPGPAAPRQRVERWRLELLRRPDYANAYRAAIRAYDERLTTTGHSCGGPTAPATNTETSHMETELANLVNTAATQTIGKRTVVEGLTKRWMTDTALKAIRDRMAAHRQWKVQPTRANALLLTQAHERARAAGKHAEQEHHRQVAARLNAAAQQKKQAQHMHATLQSMARGRRAKDAPRVMRHPVTGEEHTDVPGILSCLVTHYQRLGAAPAYDKESQRATAAAAADRVQQLSTEWHPVPAQDEAFSEAEVHQALEAMANNKAPGHDGIVAEMLKLGGAPIVRRLTQLFNEVFDGGAMPSGWRKGTIISAFKAGDSADPNNYRGITLLPVVDKLFTSLLASRIATAAPCHFNQFGFCKGRGTAEAQFNFVCALQARILSKQSSHAFFLDIRKAFDTVNRAVLLSKLHDKGVTGKLWHAVHRLYQDIRSRAASSGGVSEYFEVLQGVAQGCPMSPVLFNIYIDNLLCVLHEAGELHGIATACHKDMLGGQGYADDCNAVSGTGTGLQQLTDAMADCLENDLLLREARHKCKSMTFGPPNSGNADPGVKWRGTDIEHQETESLLGITITPTLSWLPQIARALRNGKFALHNWRPLLRSATLSVDLKLQMIKTHIVPAMSYGLSVWFPCTATERKEFHKLTTVLTDALKECLGASWARRQGHLTRGMKGDVLLADFGLPSMQTESEAAHLRFYYKHADGTTQVGTAQGARPLLGTTGPWTARSAKLLADLTSERCESDTAQEAATVGRLPEDASTPTNAELSAALHEQALERAYSAVAGVRQPAARRQRRGEHSKTISESMYALVFRERAATRRRHKPDALCRQSYLNAPQRHAAAIAMIRSGHIIDEFGSDADDNVVRRASEADVECSECGLHANHARAVCIRDLPWCHIAHKLLQCEMCPHWRAALPVFCADMLTHASATDTAYHARIAKLFASLQVDSARGRTLCSPTRDQTIGFLSLLVDPLAYLQPATSAWDGILSAVGTFLSTIKPRATCSSAREEPSDAEDGSSSASYSSSDDDYGTSAVYNPGPLWAGQPCAQRDPGTTLTPSVQNIRPVRVEHIQEEESDDEVALSGQHGNTTTEEGGVRALDAALGVVGVERTGVQAVQRGQTSGSGGVVVLDRPVRSFKGSRGLCRDRWR